MNSKNNFQINTSLNKSLGLWQSLSLVVGTIIGTGIFLKTASMAQLLSHVSLIALVWITAGLLSFCGSLTYAELSARIPESGGEYVFLKKGYGPLTAFLYGWMRFWIAAPGSIAAYGVGAATFLSSVINLESIPGGIKTLALCFIFIFTLINCFHIHWGARVQTFLTLLKVLLICGLIGGIYFFGVKLNQPLSDFNLNLNANSNEVWNFSWGAFGLAMISALWAYDGWNNLPMIGEEIKDPQKNIPRSLGFGMLVIIILYLAVNVSYFYVLPLEVIQSANSAKFPNALPVATLAAQSFLSEYGVPVLSVAFVISALGAMNGSILTAARVPFAMSRDGLFFKQLSVVSKNGHVPILSIIIQGALASLMALLGSFDELTNYVVVASWIFYALSASVVFKLRTKKSTTSPSLNFKTPLYPWLPILFIIVAMLLIINSILNSPKDAILGLIILSLGIPFYIYKTHQNCS